MIKIPPDAIETVAKGAVRNPVLLGAVTWAAIIAGGGIAFAVAPSVVDPVKQEYCFRIDPILEHDCNDKRGGEYAA